VVNFEISQYVLARLQEASDVGVLGEVLGEFILECRGPEFFPIDLKRAIDDACYEWDV
jgi:hypothetical protein